MACTPPAPAAAGLLPMGAVAQRTYAGRIHTDPETGIRTRRDSPTWAETALRRSDARPTFPLPAERLLIVERNAAGTIFDAFLTGPDSPDPRRVNVTASGYWSEARDAYHVTASGTSRSLEILLSVGHQLGYDFAEIIQSRRIEL